MIWEVLLYVFTLVAFLVTSSAIVRNNAGIAIGGAVAMAILTGLSFYICGG